MKAVELLELKEKLAIIVSNIENAEKYIEYLRNRYANPTHTMGKYREKINQWKKEKWHIEKQIVVLETKPCNK